MKKEILFIIVQYVIKVLFLYLPNIVFGLDCNKSESTTKRVLSTTKTNFSGVFKLTDALDIIEIVLFDGTIVLRTNDEGDFFLSREKFASK